MQGHLPLVFNHNPQALEAVRQIEGRRWDPTRKVWWIPFEKIFEAATRLDAVLPSYANRLRRSPRFAEAREVAAKALTTFDASRATDSDLDIPCPEGESYLPFQKGGIAYAVDGERDAVLLADEMGLGKEQPLTAGLLTPTGWKTMGDAYVGMEVVGRDGKAHKITGVFPQGVKAAYRITFSDGTSTECGIDHLWAVKDANRRIRGQGYTTKSVKALLDLGVHYSGGAPKWYIPRVEPVDFEEKALPIDPYILGVLIGDGYLVGTTIAFSVPKTKEFILAKVRSRGAQYRITGPHGSIESPQYNLCGTVHKESPILNDIRALGLNVKSKDRFIPEGYLLGSAENRLALLRGLMDTDGTSNRNRINFCSTSKRLAEDVAALVQSLGGIAFIRSHDRSAEGKPTEYRTNIRLSVCPFSKTAYKADGWKKPERDLRRYITAIEYIGDVEQQCIMVDAADHLYVTDHYIVTHNTVQAIGIANYKGFKRILVICPASLKINWYREMSKWLMTTNKINVLYSQSGPRLLQASDAVIINYDILEKWKDKLLAIDWDYVIVDEAHYIKNEKAKRSQATVALSDKAQYRAYISGTPIVNKPKELWNLLNGLDPATWNDWWWFARRYCDAHRDARGNWNAEGASNLPELQQKLRETVMVRRLKMDVLKDLPPKRRQLIEITPNSTKHLKALEAEKKIRDKFDTVLEEVKKASLSAAKAALDKAVAQAHQTKEELSEEAENKFRSAVKRLNQARFAAFEELARIRHMTALAKVDDVIAFATEALESTDKIVIFAHHHDVMDALMDAFAGKAVCVRGGMSANERQKSVDRFQHDPSIKVFVGGMYAAGVGLTLTAASTVIFAELDWVPGIIAQAEDRCHRIGQTDCVVIYHIVLQDSLDYKLAHTIVTKLEVIEQALDKQDGIEGPRLTRPEDFLTATA